MTNDLAGLFADDPEPPSQDVRYRQGVIVSFNQITLENTVLVGGTTLTNLPLLGVGEVTLLVPGAVVGILVAGGAAKTMFITGRVVTPNTSDAANAVALLNSQIYTAFVVTGESCTSTTYTDLATVGPKVTVPVGASGRILIVATAQIQWGTVPGGTASNSGRFNVEFSGANTRTPDDTVDPLVGISQLQLTTSAGNNNHAPINAVTTQAVFDGLNPGATTITMKYRNIFGATNSSEFFRRVLTVFKL